MSKPALGMVAMIAIISFVAGIAFGHVEPARSDTSGDDTATLQAMFNNVQPGATVTLDRGFTRTVAWSPSPCQTCTSKETARRWRPLTT